MKEEYVIYKGVRMTEQEAEARINNAYCDAADKARSSANVKPTGRTNAKTATGAKKVKSKG